MHPDLTNLLKIHDIVWDVVTQSDDHRSRSNMATPPKFANDNWDTARGAVEECFRYCGWSRGTLRTSYAFLVLLRLAPQELIAQNKDLEGPLEKIRQEVKNDNKDRWKNNEITKDILEVIQGALANIQVENRSGADVLGIASAMGGVKARVQTVR